MSAAVQSLGLDLGKVRDPSALALVEPWRDRLALTYLRAWSPERDDCLDTLGDVITLASKLHSRPRLALDAQGLGREVATVAVNGPIRGLCDVYPLLPTGSQRPDRQRSDGLIYITKVRAVDALLSAMADGSLVPARGLAAQCEFRRQVTRLELVPTRGGMGTTYSAPDQSEESHDDLVMAAAYALWAARHGGRFRPVQEARWGRRVA